MIPPGLTLTIHSKHKPPVVFYAGEAPDFDIVLHNDGKEPVRCPLLNGSITTPSIRVYDVNGKMLGSWTNFHLLQRKLEDAGRVKMGADPVGAILPGRASTLSINLWSYTDPLGPGKYQLEVRHRLEAPGTEIVSPRLDFEIVKSRVRRGALSYDSPERYATVLAWLAAAEASPEAERLLVRTSTDQGHSRLAEGALPLGEFAPGSRIAVSEPDPWMASTPLAWLTLTSSKQAIVIRHSQGFLEWQSDPIPLPFDDPLPVMRFPDFDEQTLFLVAGRSAEGAALAGALITEEVEVPKPWMLPIESAPSHAAALTLQSKNTVVLLVGSDDNQMRISRMEVASDGVVAVPEQVLRTSVHDVLAISTVNVKGSEPSFLVLECDREEHDRLSLIRIPASRPAIAYGRHVIPGWPELNGDGPPARAASASVEQDSTGSIFLAITDEAGGLYAGRLDRGLVKMHDSGGEPANFAHVAITRSGAVPACFSADGLLVHIGGAGHSH